SRRHGSVRQQPRDQRHPTDPRRHLIPHLRRTHPLALRLHLRRPTRGHARRRRRNLRRPRPSHGRHQRLHTTPRQPPLPHQRRLPRLELRRTPHLLLHLRDVPRLERFLPVR